MLLQLITSMKERTFYSSEVKYTSSFASDMVTAWASVSTRQLLYKTMPSDTKNGKSVGILAFKSTKIGYVLQKLYNFR